jgi:Txe/YoeB family toxin of Txe-Axe toxin-antitoxin module
MILPSKVRFLDKSLQDAYFSLQSGFDDEKKLFKSLNKAFTEIEKNAFCGIQVPKNLIPKRYIKNYIVNIWKYNLPNGWRLLYSVENQKICVVSIVIEWLDHKSYERRFKY